ncbi:hypothetical protein FBUS_10602 [Fasciolopsis buskii]|uniref:Immunoglobulin-like beta-sandwich domain-containing protein n=1 Tax=Fasciolopsis buskii TaxID=27845 RepID=A0A8E0RSY1_9TREM|nr:hypothetical protein FBUS_10602 [Fasciolopsis buski]
MPNSEFGRAHAFARNLEASTELHISVVTKEHEGQYWCRVNTSLGRAIRWINLLVSDVTVRINLSTDAFLTNPTENPVFQIGQKLVYNDWSNGQITLTCLVNSGVVATEIQWMQRQFPDDWVEILISNPVLGSSFVSKICSSFSSDLILSD